MAHTFKLEVPATPGLQDFQTSRLLSQIMGGEIYIGTSGWHYKHGLGVFYPEKKPAGEMLAFYARHFRTVEVNNSF